MAFPRWSPCVWQLRRYNCSCVFVTVALWGKAMSLTLAQLSKSGWGGASASQCVEAKAGAFLNSTHSFWAQRGGRARSQVSMAVSFEGASVPQGSAAVSSQAGGESALSAAEQQQEPEGGCPYLLLGLSRTVCRAILAGWEPACVSVLAQPVVPSLFCPDSVSGMFSGL